MSDKKDLLNLINNQQLTTTISLQELPVGRYKIKQTWISTTRFGETPKVRIEVNGSEDKEIYLNARFIPWVKQQQQQQQQQEAFDYWLDFKGKIGIKFIYSIETK